MEPATEDQIAAIDHTHEHWSEFGIAYEGYRWHLLHAVVAEAHFDQAKAEALVTELEGGAKSYGYGREDSYRARMSRDRQSVVEGKGVSVRVDSGGRRLMKKK